MTYTCECPCGTTRYKINGEPILRFYCHCTICQEQYQSPYVDVSLFKLSDVELPDEADISYHQFKRFGAVDRGRCPSCDKPILSKMGEGEKAYAFMAARNCQNAEDLPAAEMHVFYGTRAADVEDELPKYKNGISSRYAFIRRMMAAG